MFNVTMTHCSFGLFMVAFNAIEHLTNLPFFFQLKLIRQKKPKKKQCPIFCDGKHTDWQDYRYLLSFNFG